MMKKKTNPTLERIREARRRISAQHGHDIEKMIAYYRRRQEELESEKATASKNFDWKPMLEKLPLI